MINFKKNTKIKNEKESSCYQEEIDKKESSCCQEEIDKEESFCCQEEIDKKKSSCCQEEIDKEEIDKKKSSCCQEEIDKEEIDKKKSSCCQEEIDKPKIDIIKDQLEKEKNKFLRIFAEFENYKKRIQKERLDLFTIIHQQIITDFIPILDDFERGLKELKKTKDEFIIQGISLIQEKFIKILKKKGLNKIQIKKGDDFNTDFHEAITQIPVIKENLKGKIIEIIEPGYIINEKVIRHAKVITGK
ncbi:nucleotide exchange factor GrpE [Blattabacterium cuenoti]|uniref:nucleotide exchange factor GrpE n=1 Tax=Blattabacterium cuenoti TaxID=1653831 RepID=UPI00163BF79D|nr:nucleotide exchange factor GrpE [Blattabacterium cuenoti]